MAKRNLVCIVCPRGCNLEIELEGKEVKEVSGNLCPRGNKYAIDECTHPMRTVTSTVKCENGGVVAVKTDCAIPKENVFDCMKKINSLVVTLPVRIGDILLADVFGANIIATQNVDK